MTSFPDIANFRRGVSIPIGKNDSAFKAREKTGITPGFTPKGD
jgi:hypothetical protein